MYYKKDPFPKSVADACTILAGWRNCYGNRNNRFTEANDGVAFTIMDAVNSKKVKKKVITYLKCTKVGHYTKECNEEVTIKTPNKNESSYLEGIKMNMIVVLKRKTMPPSIQILNISTT